MALAWLQETLVPKDPISIEHRLTRLEILVAVNLLLGSEPLLHKLLPLLFP